MQEQELLTNLNEQIKLRPALCLDWDGTIRRSASGKTFIANARDIELIPGVEGRIWHYRNKGFLIIGVSNQGGVAHGHKLPFEIDHEMDTTLKLFATNPFHIVKMAYHMEGGTIEPYCHRSLMRKPDYGMLAIAEYEAFENGYQIDWNNSLFVGDRDEDHACAFKAQIKFMWANDWMQETPMEAPIKSN